MLRFGKMPGKGIKDPVREAATAALNDAGVEGGDLDATTRNWKRV